MRRLSMQICRDNVATFDRAWKLSNIVRIRRKLAYDFATWAKVTLTGTVKKVSQIATHLRGGMVRKRERERGKRMRCERGTFGFQPARIPFARIHQHIYAFSAFPRVCINHVDHHHRRRHRHHPRTHKPSPRFSTCPIDIEILPSLVPLSCAA